jgi:hypothetical protein
MKLNTALAIAVPMAALVIGTLSLAPGCATPPAPPPAPAAIPISLPGVFREIVFTEDLGAGTAVFGQLFKGNNNGTLIVFRDSIEHTSENRTITIPVSTVSRVTQRIVNEKAPRPWVVVEYEQDGAKKTIGFQQHGLGHEHLGEERIYQTIRHVCNHRD